MGTATLPSLSIHGLNIQDEVGRGANSLVFRASRGVDTVAVKIPREAAQSFDEEAIRRFQREGSILACLTHPALPQVHEVGVSDGRPYIVLEYIEGDSLGEQLEDGPLSCEQLLR
jgi:serine/threonine protein kinase